MKLCIIGIGGCGGRLTQKFLENRDIPLWPCSVGSYLAFGGIRGLWIESDSVETEKSRFFKPLRNGKHPEYLVPQNIIKSNSETSNELSKYGYDLRAQGFFRRADYLKAIFEIFEVDSNIRGIAHREYNSSNPILTEAWREIRKLTVLSNKDDNESYTDKCEDKNNIPAKACTENHKQTVLSNPDYNGSYTDKCDGILFAISLGGGTGTGLINPLTKHIKAERKTFPVFVLAALTELGYDNEQGSEESQRALAAMSSMQDLVTKKKSEGKAIDGIILIDNQILKNLYFSQDKMNTHIYESILPMLESRHYPNEAITSKPVSEHIRSIDLETPPIFIPCFAKLAGQFGQEANLVQKALTEGRLFDCDISKADRALIFTRGFIEADEIKSALIDRTKLKNDQILIRRNFGEKNYNEALILLRNPYGDSDAFELEGTFEYRFHNLIRHSLKYLRDNRSNLVIDMPKPTQIVLKTYFSKLEASMMEAMTRIERGNRRFFLDEIHIFGENGVQSSGGTFNVYDDNKIRQIAKEEAEKVLSRIEAQD